MDHPLEVSFTVDGQVHELTPPSPRLAFEISRRMGGVGVLLDRCQAGDLDAFAALLKKICPSAPKQEADLEAFVFANLHLLNFPLSQWVASLQWGGRDPRVLAAPQDGPAGVADGAPEGDEADPAGNAPAAAGGDHP